MADKTARCMICGRRVEPEYAPETPNGTGGWLYKLQICTSAECAKAAFRQVTDETRRLTGYDRNKNTLRRL